MTDNTTPNAHHSDDARADDGPPTDAFTDEVRADSAADEEPMVSAAEPSDADAEVQPTPQQPADVTQQSGADEPAADDAPVDPTVVEEDPADGVAPDEADIPTLNQNDGGTVEPPD
ncbi:hypothetical protein [Microbacterium sp. P02]|uniref:hypothetical protein n=1 Tax=Microbacterium sp. P02 TaxID=3366260 RepID=UPI00366D799F